MWWLNNANRIAQIRNHIKLCAQAAVARIHVATRHLLEVSLNHVHVLERTGLFTIEPFEMGAPGQFNVPDPGTSPEVPKLSQAAPLQIGDENVQQVVTVYSPSAFIGDGPPVSGDGFVLTVVSGELPNSRNWTVSFPSRKDVTAQAASICWRNDNMSQEWRDSLS